MQIGISTYSEEVLKFLPQAGILRHQVVINPPTTEGLKVMVSVGGPMVRTTHCYIQSGDSIPVIQCLDPATIPTEPVNKVFILCALAKAKHIMDRGYTPYPISITISPSIEMVDHYFYQWEMEDFPILSIDIETDLNTCELTTIGFAYEGADGFIKAISIPFASENTSYWSEELEAVLWVRIAEILATEHPKVFQNFIFDTMILSKLGIDTKGPISDTLIAAHWIQPELPKDLATLGRLYLFCDVWKDQNSWVSNETLWEYNAKDAAYTLLILQKQREVMKNEKRLEFFDNQLVPLASEVLRVCERGWNLDSGVLKNLSSTLENETKLLRSSLEILAQDFIRPKTTYTHRKGQRDPQARYAIGLGNRRPIKAVAYNEYREVTLPPDLIKLKDYPEPLFEIQVFDKVCNPNYYKDVIEVIEAMGIEVPPYKGVKSVDDLSLMKILERLKSEDVMPRQFIESLQEYRAKARLLSTYCQARPDEDGKYRFSISIPGTVEARFSSRQTPWETGFNSQNIPKSFRHLSVPHYRDWVILNADFRAADPHMVAWLSGEKKMQEILISGGDLHAHTASGIFQYDITKVPGFNKDTSKERKLGKACNNGLNYGMQIFKFIDTCKTQGLDLTFEEAKKAYEAYFRLYPGIRIWQNSIKNQITRTRTLVTPFGRRRYFYGHMNDKLYNAALAWIPPSTVADALNSGWLKVAKKIRENDIRAEVLQQCHDSMKFQVHKADIDVLAYCLLESYGEVKFNINGQVCNFPIEIEVGKSWGEMEKLNVSLS